MLFGRLKSSGRRVHFRTKREEFTKLKKIIDRGILVLLGLVSASRISDK